MKRKHPQIVNVRDVEPRVESKAEKFGYTSRRLGVQVGAAKIGTSHYEIPPGRQAFPHHFHSSNEEAVYVLEGEGQVRIGDEVFAIEPGDYVAFPVGPQSAHSIKNTGSKTLKLLAISTLNPVEVVGYPDSKKLAAVATQDASKGFMSGTVPWVRVIVKDQASLDYYEGEV